MLEYTGQDKTIQIGKGQQRTKQDPTRLYTTKQNPYKTTQDDTGPSKNKQDLNKTIQYVARQYKTTQDRTRM